MTRARCSGCALLAVLLLVLCPLAISRNDDDFDFDNNDEFQVELTANHSEIAKNGLRRLWGVPDTSAYVGHLFRMEIPKEAFSGDVVAYKVYSKSSRQTPSWLAVDSRHGLLSGLPQRAQLGAHALAVVAHGHTRGLTATDYFTIEVKESNEKPQSKYGWCRHDENRLVLVILVDGAFHRIPPRHRIRALMDLAAFMALDGDEFSMEPYKAESVRGDAVLLSGAGTTQRKRNDAATAIYLNVGCSDKLWSRHKVLVGGLREQARDGTLAHLLRLPVLGWRLLARRPNKPALRPKRQSSIDGSGAYDTYDGEDDGADYSGDYDDDDDEDFPIDTLSEPVVKITPYTEAVSESSEVNKVDQALEEARKFLHSPVIISPEDASTTTEPEMQTVIIRASNELPPISSEAPTTPTSPTSVTSPSPSPTDFAPTETTTPTTVSTTPSTTSTTTTTTTTTTQAPTTTVPPTTTSPTTTPLIITTPPTTTPVPETTLQEVTKQELPLSSERSSTIVGRTTETVTFPMPPNQPPTLRYHMKKLAITAGKAFRYIIPGDLFSDPEEGSNLTFTMYDSDNVPLPPTSWIQFIPAKREVYGLPLESHVSRWNFRVEAQDSEGLVARGPLDITVQQHKGQRTINHQFIMQFKLLKQYTNAIDWQIRALEGIVNLFRDTDMDHLTVLNATLTGDLCEYVWTNDTLPKDPSCPMDDINRLMKIMESDTEPGKPSSALLRAMSPELGAVRVRWAGAGRCAAPAPPRTRPHDTYPPVTRNQVDHLTATVGHLQVYKVPEDTFFDPEDGGTRNLALSLRRADRSELAAEHWLQFDPRNQEFYGLPSAADEGTVHYQLIAEDSSKKSAYDSLIVEVVKAPTIRPTVEFHMTLDNPYSALASSARAKRRLLERLANLFDQHHTDNIRVHAITDNPTTIVWYNTSLPMDRCPKKEIEELRKMIIVDERGTNGGNLQERVDTIFDKDFNVMSIRLVSQGLCAEQNTKMAKGGLGPINAGTNLQNKASNADPEYSDYLVTFVIPAVVIVCMILVAGVIACVLYKRRRTGKMSVGDEEERQAFRSKGIPVIFQDELEERGDTEPVHKSPVIMREEKPPLLPPAPDYRAGEDAPYRPPPPFAASRTPPRPKATPTYRKPPPYVPP
ncbi:PREDICTED: dystroglycan isoform X1 [Papilio xuthus]|uniref:Dystroglycan 1 n=1 Tax=Papilio xuthus TaxID=66420 RepID=A0AAJ7E4V3_PAPXU|nr:PREDICTED: dystroglycan isoform X1 [Papilio xuthus]XP_013162811.1 PREDICTED: dystroglycan isoform X1 [Papilio xuthus]